MELVWSRSLTWLALCAYTVLLCGPASCVPISYAAMDHGRLGELQADPTDLQSLHTKEDWDSSPKDYNSHDYSTYDAYTSDMLPPPIVTREPEVITVGCRSGFLGRGGDCRPSFSTFMFTVTDLHAARKPTPHRMIPNPSLYSLFPSFSSNRRRTLSNPSSTTTRPQTQREWLSSYSGFSRGRALLEKRNRNRQSRPSPVVSDTTSNNKLYTIPTPTTVESTSDTKLYNIPTPTKPYDFGLNIQDKDDLGHNIGHR
ncbi:unnamed protein product [Meganyctiphanes norvegica]|uniref:Uncharacterized protein n=1 Tax=Meganyctiphanes norvegica TaxID=48144 RepID=A0AAV2QV85_MEGNR